MKLYVALLPLSAAWTPAIQPSFTRFSITRQSAVSMAESEDVLRAKAYVFKSYRTRVARGLYKVTPHGSFNATSTIRAAIDVRGINQTNGLGLLHVSRYLMGEAPATAPANAANLQVDDDARLHALKGAQKALMAPLLAGAPPGSKQETFVRVLDSFMMDYAESSYEVGDGKHRLKNAARKNIPASRYAEPT